MASVNQKNGGLRPSADLLPASDSSAIRKLATNGLLGDYSQQVGLWEVIDDSRVTAVRKGSRCDVENANNYSAIGKAGACELPNAPPSVGSGEARLICASELGA